MRTLAFVMALSIGLGVAAAEEQAAAPAKKQKPLIVLPGSEIKGDAHLPPALVLTRSKAAKADVDSASNHLEDAAERR